MMQLKLSIFYFVYFALLGVMAPYMALYLSGEGFSPAQVGVLMGLLLATKIVAPNVWGIIADRYQKRLLLVRLGAFATLLTYSGFFFAEAFWHYALMVVLFSSFWNAVLPQFEVVTLHSLGNRTSHYSRIRVWGSIGFIVAVLLCGAIFDQRGIDLFPYALLLIISSIFLSAFFRFKEPAIKKACDELGPTLVQQLKAGNAYLFFVVCFLLQLSHGAYYSYFNLHLESLGYGKTAIGIFWAIGVIAEVGLFFIMHRWHAKHSVKLIMIIALVLSSLRWVLIAEFSDTVLLLIIAQTLHAFSFGAMHAASIHFVHHHFSVFNQGRAQAMYSSLGFGLGGAVGALLMASIVSQLGYARLFWVSSVVVILAIVVVAKLRPTASSLNHQK